MCHCPRVTQCNPRINGVLLMCCCVVSCRVVPRPRHSVNNFMAFRVMENHQPKNCGIHFSFWFLASNQESICWCGSQAHTHIKDVNEDACGKAVYTGLSCIGALKALLNSSSLCFLINDIPLKPKPLMSLLWESAAPLWWCLPEPSDRNPPRRVLQRTSAQKLLISLSVVGWR